MSGTCSSLWKVPKPTRIKAHRIKYSPVKGPSIPSSGWSLAAAPHSGRWLEARRIGVSFGRSKKHHPKICRERKHEIDMGE